MQRFLEAALNHTGVQVMCRCRHLDRGGLHVSVKQMRHAPRQLHSGGLLRHRDLKVIMMCTRLLETMQFLEERGAIVIQTGASLQRTKMKGLHNSCRYNCTCADRNSQEHAGLSCKSDLTLESLSP
jgi:hypothetical protein